LIRFTAAPFRSRNSPETGRALRQPAPAPKVGDLWTPALPPDGELPGAKCFKIILAARFVWG